VMTNGYGAMQDYAAQVTVADSWAISAYKRALQLSRRASPADVPAERRADLDRAPDVAPPAAQPPPGDPAGSAPPGAPSAPAAVAPAQENE
jgi:hypothetical protein